jgi:hypothetical protein
MPLDGQSQFNPQARAVEIEDDAGAVHEQTERILLALAGGLAAVVISAVWVSLSLG